MIEPADLDLVRGALDSAETIVVGIGAQQADAPTPCASWSVAELMNHLLNDLAQFEASAAGGALQWSAQTPSVEPAAWVPTFTTRSAALIAAWSAADDTASLGMQLAELALHTWDLAQATGQPFVGDDDVALRGLDWMTGMLEPEYRGSEADGKSFGPEIGAPADAPPILRLVAFSGRPLPS